MTHFVLLGRKTLTQSINCSFVCLFIQTDTVTMVSHECLEQSWWNLTGNNPKSLLMTWLDSGGQRSRSQQAVVVMKASSSTLGRQVVYYISGLYFLSYNTNIIREAVNWTLEHFCTVLCQMHVGCVCWNSLRLINERRLVDSFKLFNS